MNRGELNQLRQLRLVVTVLAAEPGLAPVWNWQHNGVPACHGDPRC